MYTLDTNVIIYFLQNDLFIENFFLGIPEQERIFCISVVTEMELFSFQKLTPTIVDDLYTIMSLLKIFPLDSHLAHNAATIRRSCSIKGLDAIIAATAIFTGSTLLTRNSKDFKKVSTLKLQQV